MIAFSRFAISVCKQRKTTFKWMTLEGSVFSSHVPQKALITSLHVLHFSTGSGSHHINIQTKLVVNKNRVIWNLNTNSIRISIHSLR